MGRRMATEPYIGRLAPSPTGRYHLGNLSTAMLAYLRALRAGGSLLYRLEDLDGPREQAGSAETIADDLRWLGVRWTAGPDCGGPHAPYVQSQASAFYEAALERLRENGRLYPCTCSRKEIAEVLSAPHGRYPASLLYAGTCRGRGAVGNGEPHALRFAATGVERLTDALAPELTIDVREEPGDVVVKRRDGCFAYHLAVVVDDLRMGVTEVVRGRDLLTSTALHREMARALGGRYPSTCHVPLILDASGGRLAKRDAALGRPALEAVGYTPELLRGLFGHLWGFFPDFAPRTVEELAEAWRDEGLRPTALQLHPAAVRGPEALSEALRNG